jgi:phosphatidylglycerol---prolipoprotein diacylglyceryl transferase
MRTILFHIPSNIGGVPLLGFGILLPVWTCICIVRLGWIIFRRGWSSEIANELPMMLLLAAVIAWVLPALADDTGLPIRGYGVMVFLGVISGVALSIYRAQREGYSADLIYSLALWMCVFAILGARLFYVIEYWDESFHKETLRATLVAVLNYTQGGLVVYGAFAGGVLAAAVFFVRHKLPVLKFADIVAPSLVLGLALGRIGCFLNGCCYGGLCDRPWAVTFPAGSPVYLHQASRGQLALDGIHFDPDPFATAVIQSVDQNSIAAQAGLHSGDRIPSILVEPPGPKKPFAYPADESMQLSVAGAIEALANIQEAGTKVTFRAVNATGQAATHSWTIMAPGSPVTPPRSLPVHPTQLYSAIGALLLTLFLLAWYPFRRHAGEVTALMITIYPLMRILEESIRTDEPLVGRTGMTISQNASVLLLAAAITLWIFVLRSPRLRYASPHILNRDNSLGASVSAR